MAIDPAKTCLFIPSELKKFKLDLFNRIGRKIERPADERYAGIIRRSMLCLMTSFRLSAQRRTFCRWCGDGENASDMWIGWDRGYARRVFATWLPRGENGGYYRWTIGAYQMRTIRDVPGDRWDALRIPLTPWQKNGKHIVVALPSPTYSRSHDGTDTWTEETLRRLALITDRQIVIRDKESKRPLQADLDGAHCLVAHGSIAAVEAVICGCPVRGASRQRCGARWLD
jgi:hypothetical protein